ncbi:MAG: hypothetical protein ABI036_06990 [Fibrobacteria bacterium]
MQNNRRDFLKLTGMLGAGSLLPLRKSTAAGAETVAGQAMRAAGACTLIPTETAGPFPLDLTANTFYFRQDIRENRTGAPLRLKLKVLGLADCAPLPNVRVNIWQCDKDGKYSGYDNSMNPGQAGLTYLRGYQVADAAGEVGFTTIFPGWYGGRVCHIHFQIYVSTSYSAVSQLAFEPAAKNAVYAANPSLYVKGADPLTAATDSIFSDGYAYQVASLTPNADKGGYDAYLEVTVDAARSTGLGHEEKQNGKQFTLGQSYPNPHLGAATIPFTLSQGSDVALEIWDLAGKKRTTIRKPALDAGAHELKVDLEALGLGSSNCLYQFEVSNGSGTFKQFRILTAVRP